MTEYLDLHSLSEADRLKLIARMVIESGREQAIVLEDHAKADRYVSGLLRLGVMETRRALGPVPNTLFVFIAPADPRDLRPVTPAA